MLSKLLVLIFTNILIQVSWALPSAPQDPSHPGSPIYELSVTKETINCAGRQVQLYKPNPIPTQPTALVVFGHGQALNASHYEATFQHLARKGLVAIHPAYDTGFFDQNWSRMASDYLSQTTCIVNRYATLINPQAVVFSGHSKGAYVASIAAGQSFIRSAVVKPASVVLFSNAGTDQAATSRITRDVELTVIYGEGDSIVPESHSRTAYNSAQSLKKQFILLKKYPAPDNLTPGHMFPLSKSTAFGGGPVGPFHYYGTWKWLTAAAWDALEGGTGDEPYLFGAQALEKGIPGLLDQVERNF